MKGVVDTGATPLGGAGIESGARSRRGKCTIQDDNMKTWLPKNRKELKKHLSDPLFKNAYFPMFSSLTSAGSGFFFWLIAARFYSTADVGLASAIISAMGLISMLSLLGIAKGTGIIFIGTIIGMLLGFIGRVILLRFTRQTTAFIP